MRIDDSALHELRTQGFTVVPGFLNRDEVDRAREVLWKMYPTPEQYFASPETYPEIARSQFAGLRLFPGAGLGLEPSGVPP